MVLVMDMVMVAGEMDGIHLITDLVVCIIHGVMTVIMVMVECTDTETIGILMDMVVMVDIMGMDIQVEYPPDTETTMKVTDAPMQPITAMVVHALVVQEQKLQAVPLMQEVQFRDGIHTPC